MPKKAALHPWHPAEYDQAITGAIKALAAGVANDAQQKRALDWIISSLCGACGRAFTGRARAATGIRSLPAPSSSSASRSSSKPN